MGEEGGRILFNKKPNIDPMKIFGLVQQRPWELSIKGQDKLYFEYEARRQWSSECNGLNACLRTLSERFTL